jgi:phosphoglucosamine mutase
MKQSKQSLNELLQKVTLFPQTLNNVRYKAGYEWQTDNKLKEVVAAAEKELAGTGRILIRASGTEALLRVMVEAQDAHQAQTLAQKIGSVIPV